MTKLGSLAISINNLTKQSSVLACSFGLEEELMLENNLKNQLVDFFYNLSENSSLKKILGNIIDDPSLSKTLIDYSGKEIVSGVLTTLTDIYTFYLISLLKMQKRLKAIFVEHISTLVLKHFNKIPGTFH